MGLGVIQVVMVLLGVVEMMIFVVLGLLAYSLRVGFHNAPLLHFVDHHARVWKDLDPVQLDGMAESFVASHWLVSVVFHRNVFSVAHGIGNGLLDLDVVHNLLPLHLVINSQVNGY